ncbi:MAG: dihydrofolate reductase [Oscillospiraceae bacterium]|jgi:dihydrofolate reductase|nr:dihydrofolate reductase [Oscillospiraceae bacterium]
MNIIVAVNSDWGIGYNNTQSIVISEDRRHFKKITDGGVLIAGRKTFEDLGRPLPDRKTIVITRDRKFNVKGVVVAHSVDEVLAKITDEDSGKVFVIGGGSIYRLFLPLCSNAYVTKIDAAPPSDTFFPNLDNMPEWSLETRGETRESGGVRYSFDRYVRS